LLAVAAMLVASAASASTITYGTSTDGSSFTVSNADLLQTAGATLSFLGQYNTGEYCGTPSLLTNGAFGTKGTSNVGYTDSTTGKWVVTASGSHTSTCAIVSNSTATYTLDTSVNTAGYDVTGINIFSSWSDSGRCATNVVVLYSTVADPTTFITIGTATSGSVSCCNAAYITTNLTGVKSIEFVFPTQQNGYAGYNELDVVGALSVPEPSSTALGLMSAASLLAYTWRKRRKIYDL
jgi:hypothetical protein